MAKLLGTNIGAIQQDLSILLKDESIEVSKKVIFSNPKYGVHLLTDYTQLSTKKQKTFFTSVSFGKQGDLRKHKQTVDHLTTNIRATNSQQLTDSRPTKSFGNCSSLLTNLSWFFYNTYTNTEYFFFILEGPGKKETKISFIYISIIKT